VTSVTVELPAALATAGTRGRFGVEIAAPSGLTTATTVADVLDVLALTHPVLERRLRDETGQVRRFVNLYVDGEDIRRTGGPATPVPDGAELLVVPSVAGG